LFPESTIELLVQKIPLRESTGENRDNGERKKNLCLLLLTLETDALPARRATETDGQMQEVWSPGFSRIIAVEFDTFSYIYSTGCRATPGLLLPILQPSGDEVELQCSSRLAL